MQEKKDVDVCEVFLKAFNESNGETLDLVVEHELHGITPEMIAWFFPHADEYYKLWHPEDHVGWRWVVPPTQGRRGGSIKISVQKFGDLPVCELRMRIENPSETPFDKSTGAGWSSFLGPDDVPYGCATHVYKAAPYGTWMRSTFRWPAKTPQWLLDAVRKHNVEEMGQLPKFVPDLYKKNVG